MLLLLCRGVVWFAVDWFLSVTNTLERSPDNEHND